MYNIESRSSGPRPPVRRHGASPRPAGRAPTRRPYTFLEPYFSGTPSRPTLIVPPRRIVVRRGGTSRPALRPPPALMGRWRRLPRGIVTPLRGHGHASTGPVPLASVPSAAAVGRGVTPRSPPYRGTAPLRPSISPACTCAPGRRRAPGWRPVVPPPPPPPGGPREPLGALPPAPGGRPPPPRGL